MPATPVAEPDDVAGRLLQALTEAVGSVDRGLG
jgi:hypothetical protein